MTRFFRFLCVILLLPVLARPQTSADLRILLGAPQGETTSIDQSFRIVATFSEPMTALTAVPDGPGPGPLSIAPAVAGTYRWLGTTTLAFMPADTLPYATRFTVTIPAGTRAVSGAQLAQPFTWSFETPRPGVVRTSPASGDHSIEPDHTILVVFNQPIDLATVGRWISLEETSTSLRITYEPFSVRHPTDEELRGGRNRPLRRERALTGEERRRLDRERACALVIVPSAPFEKGSTVRVLLKAGLQAKEGPLGMKTDYAAAFSIYGDLAFTGVHSDDKFHPAHALRFDFTNPVSVAELARHISLTPQAARRPGFDDEYASTQQYVTFDLKPETEYTGMISAGLKDIFGNVLAQDAPFSFRTASYPPSISMTTGPGLLEAYEAHAIPVTFLNADSARLMMGGIPPEQIVPFVAGTNFYENEPWTDRTLRRSGNGGAIRRVWRMTNPRNRAVVKPLALDEALGGQAKKGVVFVQLQPYGTDHPRVLQTVVQVTEIGLTAKFSPESMLIWATTLKDAAPVAGADVEVRTDSNRVVWRGRTDARGAVSAPGWAGLGIEPVREYYGQGEEYESVRAPRLWVIVRKGDDCAFTSSQWNEGIEPYTFAIDVDWNPQPDRYEAVLFTDRGLYKANETVDVKGIVRSRTGGAWSVQQSLRLRVRVTDPRGEEMTMQDVTLNAFGSFALRLPIAASAPTGYYQMAVEARQRGANGKKERWTPFANASFRVEAFRAAEFEVRARLDRDAYMIGDTARGFLSAQYLFGAPMKKAPMRYRFSLAPTSFTPKGYDAYFFGAADWLSEYAPRTMHRVLSSGEGVLDEFGSMSVSAPLSTSEITGTVLLTLEGDATSVSRQTLSGRTSVIVHGGDYYVGVKPSTTFLSTDSTLSIDLVTVTPDGTPRSERDLTLTIHRRVWRSVRKAVTGGRYEWQSEIADSLMDSSAVRSTHNPVTHRFTPKSAGFYYITVRSTDERGNVIRTQATFYVSGSEYVAWARSDDDRIELIADREHYQPGERAEILVKNPYERATALVTIEREGIMSHYTTSLEGSAPKITLPIERSFLPNVFVSVVLIQGRIDRPADSQEKDLGRPSFKIGYVKLSVSPKEKQLRVQVASSRAAYHPGDSAQVTITVRTSDGRGVRSEVALSVADQGVLSLIGYHLPDPFDVFYRERGLAVTTAETRLHLVRQRSYGEKAEDVGGGGASFKAAAELDAEGVRKDFRASAYWHPTLVTDDSGRVTVRFRLPDNITSFTAMAAAQTLQSEFGEGEASFTVTKPVLLQPSLPRLARAGDAFSAGVVVVNYTSEHRRVAVRATASGIGFAGGDSAVIELAPGQARELTYRFTAERMGTAVVTVKARSGADEDGLRWTFPIIAPRVKETTALFNSSAEARREEMLRIPAAIMPDQGDVEVTAASTALVGLSGAVRYLFTYPYGCLEQRASSVLPIILAKDLIDAFRLDVFRHSDERAVAQTTIDELPMFQKFNGGFSYWKNDEETSPYVSAYAVYTLLEAKEHGYRVNARALDNGLQYLTRVLAGEEQDQRYSVEAGQCTRALIVYVLARAGRPDFGAMERLFSERRSLPLFAKAYVMRASALADKQSQIVNALAREFLNTAKIDPAGAAFEEPSAHGLYWIFHSNTRTTAVILQALVEAEKDADLSAKIVRRLLGAQRNGRWRTTQENMYVVSALAAYFKKYENAAPDFKARIAVAGKTLLESMFRGRSLETEKGRVPIASLEKERDLPIAITKDGAGRLYYGVRMTYIPKGQSVERNEGVTVLRSMEPAEGGPAARTIRAGMLMKVTVSVVAHQDRHFVAVEDPVPSGFEVVATTFATSASNLSENEGRSYSVFHHVERYDDRVALFADRMPAGIHSYTYLVRAIHPGTFVVPPTSVECMYEPEIFGRTASGSVTIQ